MDTEDELRRPADREQVRRRGVRTRNGNPGLSIASPITQAAVAGDVRLHERLQTGG